MWGNCLVMRILFLLFCNFLHIQKFFIIISYLRFVLIFVVPTFSQYANFVWNDGVNTVGISEKIDSCWNVKNNFWLWSIGNWGIFNFQQKKMLSAGPDGTEKKIFFWINK